ncbi:MULTISPECIES: benenodin family lasso peptide [Sphingobium]|nr:MULTISPECIES: benenodin family lasso peptide [Sphingomonadaceae]MEC6698575.1 benenodin family lasso peptide [Sphingobium sp. SJ10-10]NML87714.1 benenodin family lasso peptide [Sphingobium sp. TB-6]
MERDFERNEALIDLGSAVEQTKGIEGKARDVDQSPLTGMGILDE